MSLDEQEPTVEAFARALDEAGSVDELEERRMLAKIEQRMFERSAAPLRLSRYLLLNPLGTGGAGVVYDGYDPELARRVAIKVLRPDRHNSDAAIRSRVRFVREAQSIARLSHPNVIAVYDVGTYSTEELEAGMASADTVPRDPAKDDAVFIVMEVVDGADGRTWLDEKTRSWREVLDVFIAAGKGLAAAHGAGLIHRDFKPGNVLVGKDGRVKVVDFGLALNYGAPSHASASGSDSGAFAEYTAEATGRLTSEDLRSASLDSDSGMLPEEKLTRTGVVLGTPVYMAPEQHAGDAADQKADQFSFCASLYRALYGRFPYPGKTVDQLSAAKHVGPRKPPDRTGVPQWIWRIVERGLAPDPDDRFTDMAAIIRALENDPARVRRRWMRRTTVPLAVAALAYSGYVLSRPGEVDVVVSSDGESVPGISVFVDDVALEVEGGRAHGSIAAGLHRVRVAAPDYHAAETIIEVSRGGTHEVALELEHEKGVFDLEVDPRGGSVLVDGVDFGSRLTKLEIDTGNHEIVVRAPGYEDQRLRWQATQGEVTRGFVSLRKALVWSQPVAGANPWSRWLGDATGDGRSELVHRRFNLVTAYDPWRGDDLWRFELWRNVILDSCDADGDGIAELVTVEWEPDRGRVAVRSSRPSGPYEPTLSWEVPADESRLDDMYLPLGRASCVDGVDGTRLLVVGGPWGPRVRAFDGRDGTSKWSVDLDAPVTEIALLGGYANTRIAVATTAGVSGIDITGARLWDHVTPPADDEWVAKVAQERSRDRSSLAASGVDRIPGDDVVWLTGSVGAPRLVAIGGASGARRWQRELHGTLDLRRSNSALDADGDGTTERIVAVDEGFAVLDGGAGTELWKQAKGGLDGATLVQLSTGAVVVTTRGGGLSLRDAMTGEELAHRDDVLLTSAAVGADWDGDGDLEVVAGTRDADVVAWDEQLAVVGKVPMPVPVSRLDSDRDGDVDGFADLLLEAGGPAVITGPKVRWRRGYNDAVRAGPIAARWSPQGPPEVLVLAPDADDKWMHVLDALDGTQRIASNSAGSHIVRRPGRWQGATGTELFVVGDGMLRRLRGTDLQRLAETKVESAWAPPAVADVDHDGQPEVFQAAWDPRDYLMAFDATNLREKWRVPIAGGSFDAPAIADIDGDGVLELVVSSLGGEVAAVDATTGTKKWSADLGGRLNYSPAIGDADGDGTVELYVSPKVEANDLVVLRGDDGEILARWPAMGSRRSQPVLVDTDGDGRPEIVSATRDQGVVKLAADGTQQWRYGFIDQNGQQPSSSGPAVLADLEEDGQFEVLAGFEDGSVRVLDAASGDLVWAFHTGGGDIEGPPSVLDVDGDGIGEVFIGAHDRYVYCLRHRRPSAATP